MGGVGRTGRGDRGTSSTVGQLLMFSLEPARPLTHVPIHLPARVGVLSRVTLLLLVSRSLVSVPAPGMVLLCSPRIPQDSKPSGVLVLWLWSGVEVGTPCRRGDTL